LIKLKGTLTRDFRPFFCTFQPPQAPCSSPKFFFKFTFKSSKLFKFEEITQEYAPPGNQTPWENAPPRNQTPWEYAPPRNQTPGRMLLPAIRLPGSMLLKAIRLPGSMLLLQIENPGGAYSGGVDFPGVCSSRGSNQNFQTHSLGVNRGIRLPGKSKLPGGAYSRGADSRVIDLQEEHTPGESNQWEYAPPGNQTPRQYAPPGA